MTDDSALTRRVHPPANYMTKQIIEAPQGSPEPLVAPDVLEPIDPGPVLGVSRGADLDAPELPVSVTPALVASLQSVQAYPCVSLLLPTRPGPRLHPDDAERLERLRLDALRRLGGEQLADGAALVAELDRAVRQALGAEAQRSLAVYVGAGVSTVVSLPVEVEERVVIDPTFATRDLVKALHRTPRHVVLVLSAQRAALLDGAGGRLMPVTGTQFPVSLATLDGRPRDAESLVSVLRGVDLALGAYLRLHPAPLVVVGPQAVVTAFRSGSRNLARLAGTVYGGFDDTSADELVRRTAPVLRRYLASRQLAALKLLDQRRQEDRVASGIVAAWRSCRVHRPEMLLVEEGFRYPARLSPDGDVPSPATDVEAPDVIDDLVDELVEVVLDRGGWVALAQDGALAADGRVALTLR